MTQRCTLCGETKPATSEHFSPDKRRANGVQSRCKVCRAAAEYEHNKAWRLSHPEEQRAAERAWKEAHPVERREEARRLYWRDPEKCRQRRIEYGAQNREAERERNRAYYQSHVEMERARRQKWQQEHPEENAAKSRKARAARAGAAGSHSAQDISEIYEAQGGRCYYCGSELNGKYHVDHMVPLFRGGSNNPDNLRCACPSCNCSKGTKTHWEFCPEGTPDGC